MMATKEPSLITRLVARLRAYPYLRKSPTASTRHKIERHTYAERKPDGTVTIRYHQTDIITVSPKGQVTVTSGGYKTNSTKERISAYLRPYASVWQREGLWYISYQGVTVPFEDGMVINRKPKVKPNLDAEQRTLRKKVFAFAKEYVRQLRDGEMPAPGPGDCLICAMEKQGGMKGHEDHILSHLEEGYYVPRIMYNALETMPSSVAMKACVQARWTGDDAGHFDMDFVWTQILRCLRKYLLRQVGLPS